MTDQLADLQAKEQFIKEKEKDLIEKSRQFDLRMTEQ